MGMAILFFIKIKRIIRNGYGRGIEEKEKGKKGNLCFFFFFFFFFFFYLTNLHVVVSIEGLGAKGA
jgi:hypothetical protein